MIGSAINLGSFLLDFASRISPESKEIGSAADIANRAKHSYNVISTTSVTQSANRAIIAPMVAIEHSLLHQEFMSDLMQVVTLRDIIATLTHLALQGSVGVGVKVENVIGTIQPNRAGMMALMGTEALDTSIKAKAPAEAPPAPNTVLVNVGGKAVNDLQEFGPLAVGKVVTASIATEAGGKIDFPLTFRQIPVPIQPKDLLLTFTAAKESDGYFARLLMMKSGEITGPEFLSGKDIVKEKFRIANEEMSGYYKEAMRRESGNRMMALKTGLISFNTMANTFIISKDTTNWLELEIGKSFSDPRGREQILKAVKANTIVVCNEDRGIYTFYTHGAAIPEVYTRKDLQSKSKKDSGSNTLADLVKLLNGGA